MIQVSDSELRDQSRTRDAASTGNFEARFREAEPFIAKLKKDYALRAIADMELIVGVTGRHATLEEAAGTWRPGGDRRVSTHWTRAVEVSYIARGRMYKFSHDCGCVPAKLETDAARTLAEATGQRIKETLHKIEVVLAQMPDLDVVYGGVYHMNDAGDPWIADASWTVEAPAQLVCIVCGEDVYYANESWRHKSTRQAEAYDEADCRFCEGSGEVRGTHWTRTCSVCMGTRKAKKLNHVAAVEASDA